MNFENVRTDSTGWPTGTTPEAKTALTEAVKTVLTRNPKGVELWVLVGAVKNIVPRAVWDPPVVLDYQYAAVERAVRATGALHVWQLPPQG